MSDPLLSPAELSELERLRKHLHLRVGTEGPGSRASRCRGASAEFVDHRGYTAGDDLRRLDWNVLARTDQPVIKRFRAEEEAMVRIGVDVSASMSVGQPSKLWFARRLAAAIGYLALAEGERAQVATLSRRSSSVDVPRRGRGQYGVLQRGLSALQAEGPMTTAEHTKPDALVDAILRRSSRPGMLVFVTDALSPDGDVVSWSRAIVRARAAGHDVRLVQVLAPEDVDPPWDGDLDVEDAETGARVHVVFDAVARAEYRRMLDALVASLREACRGARATYVKALSNESVLAVVRRLSLGGGDEVPTP